jgi:hypothetical protein
MVFGTKSVNVAKRSGNGMFFGVTFGLGLSDILSIKGSGPVVFWESILENLFAKASKSD